jgi:hypothetical protein
MKQSEKCPLRPARPILYLIVRYYAAFTLLGYSFAKIMGAQFTVLDSELAKPMGEVSAFWLTWYYFGYSAIYSNFIAIAQIGGAVLLCFRRTALVGALVLLPVAANIVAIDIWVIGFSLSDGALLVAIFVLVALLGIIAFHLKDLYAFFVQRRDDLALLAHVRPWILVAQVAIVAGMVGYSAHRAYWVANVNNRAPTPIDGAWHVTHVDPRTRELPEWIYFEYNRAFLTVFTYPNGPSEYHDFRVNQSERTVTISQQWGSPGSDIFKGEWKRNGDTLGLAGLWRNRIVVNITLQRKRMPIKDHQ